MPATCSPICACPGSRRAKKRPRNSGRQARHRLETSEETPMKRREFTRLAAFAAVLVATTALIPGGHAVAQDKKFKIGFSQATTIEPWRAQFNKDIIAEAAKHPEVELIVTDGEDKTEK